VLANNFC